MGLLSFYSIVFLAGVTSLFHAAYSAAQRKCLYLFRYDFEEYREPWCIWVYIYLPIVVQLDNCYLLGTYLDVQFVLTRNIVGRYLHPMYAHFVWANIGVPLPMVDTQEYALESR